MIGKCDGEVFSNGQSVCIVDIPKETAETICRNLSAVTGCKVDWHYIGGRVHIKAVAAPVVERQVPAAWLWEHKIGMAIATVSRRTPFNEHNIEGIHFTVAPLYTSPPAPVAVAINENAEFEKWRNEQIAVLVRNGYPDGAEAFRELGSVQWAGWQARACLDKGKVLNQ